MLSEHTSKPADKKYDVVIVGMGPVGLAAAYTLAREGKYILLIEKRTEENTTLRPQAITLNHSSKEILVKMINKADFLIKDDIKFLETIIQSDAIQISLIQKFILNRIYGSNSRQYSAEKKMENAFVEIEYNTNIESVDIQRGEVTTKKNGGIKTIYFSQLIAADGAKAETLEKVNEKLDSDKKIERYTPFGMQHLNDIYHFGAYLRMKRRDGEPFDIPEKEFISSFNENEESYFNSYELFFMRFNKKSHEKSSHKEVKFSFLGEAPKKVYGQYMSEPMRDPIMLAYIKNITAHYLKIPVDELIIDIKKSKKKPAKDKLKTLAFQGEMMKASHAALQENNHGFYLIGDAYCTPNYVFGHGLNDGLATVEMFKDLPANQDDDAKLSRFITIFNESSEEAAQMTRSKTQAIYWARVFGESFEPLRKYINDSFETSVGERENSHKIMLKTDLVHSIDRKVDIVERYLDSDIFKKNVFMNNLEEARSRSNEDPRNIELKKKISTWIHGIDLFLVDHPAIAKQYRVKILDNMNLFKDRIDKFGHSEVQVEFQKIYAKFQSTIKKYNDEIIHQSKSEPDKIDESGRTLLDHALLSADIETIKQVLQNGASLNKTRLHRERLIFNFRLSIYINPTLTRLLLEHGANPFVPIFPISNETALISPFHLSFSTKLGCFNPVFAIECLSHCLQCVYQFLPMHKEVHSQLSPDFLASIIDSMKNQDKWKLFFGSDVDKINIFSLKLNKDAINEIDIENALKQLQSSIIGAVKQTQASFDKKSLLVRQSILKENKIPEKENKIPEKSICNPALQHSHKITGK